MTAVSIQAFPDIDYEYRPRNYFFPMLATKYLLSTIKGTERRREVERLIDEGKEQEIEDWMAHSALEDSTRKLIGSFHPALLGGEYLPDLEVGEVEIARLELASTTGDVVSVRARQSKGRTYYRLTDEYHDDRTCAFKVSPFWSVKPLSLLQLINLIETATDKEHGEISFGLSFLDESYRQFDFDLDICRKFLSVTSEFYPDLQGYYIQAIDSWYQQCLSELDDED